MIPLFARLILVALQICAVSHSHLESTYGFSSVSEDTGIIPLICFLTSSATNGLRLSKIFCSKPIIFYFMLLLYIYSTFGCKYTTYFFNLQIFYEYFFNLISIKST